MKSNRIPRKLLGAWIPRTRRNSTPGRPLQTIRHSYVETLKNLGFEKECKFETWMTEAKNRKIWGTRVEYFLGLPEGSYSRTNARKSYAELRSFE